MAKEKKIDVAATPTTPQECTTYKVDKMTFIVTPVYRENGNKTVHDIILGLMIIDREKPCC